MAIDSLFPERLSSSERQHIKSTLKVDHARRFAVAIRNAIDKDVTIDSFSVLLQALKQMVQDWGQLPEWANHWSIPFLATELTQSDNRAKAALNYLLPTLLFEGCSGRASLLEGLHFKICLGRDGSLPLLPVEKRLCIRNLQHPFATLNVECANGVAALWRNSDPAVAVRIALPWSAHSAADTLQFHSFERLDGWNIPLLPSDLADLFVENGRTQTVNEEDSSGAVAANLRDAYHILRQTWPAVLEWFELLVPAVADVGDPLQAGSNYSGSFGPGMPICLSKVTDPLYYAENLLHELQHQRFLLAIPSTQWFGRWRDIGFISPYRPDPRPLSGVHLGLHAFLAVNELRLRALKRGVIPVVRIAELLRTHRQNLFAFRTLQQHEEFSCEGSLYCSAMAACLHQHSQAIEPLANPKLEQEVTRELQRHVASTLRSAPEAENRNVSVQRATGEDWKLIAPVKAFAEAL